MIEIFSCLSKPTDRIIYGVLLRPVPHFQVSWEGENLMEFCKNSQASAALIREHPSTIILYYRVNEKFRIAF